MEYFNVKLSWSVYSLKGHSRLLRLISVRFVVLDDAGLLYVLL